MGLAAAVYENVEVGLHVSLGDAALSNLHTPEKGNTRSIDAVEKNVLGKV